MLKTGVSSADIVLKASPQVLVGPWVQVLSIQWRALLWGIAMQLLSVEISIHTCQWLFYPLGRSLPTSEALSNQEASTVAKVLVNEWTCRFSAPDVIHLDQGKNFESCLFVEVCHLHGMEKIRTTPYHLQSDWLVERFNWTLRPRRYLEC